MPRQTTRWCARSAKRGAWLAGKTHGDGLHRIWKARLSACFTSRPLRYLAKLIRATTYRLIVECVLARGRDWKSWASLDYALVFLAEAVPDAFLSAIERDLESDSPAAIALFSNGGDGFFSDVPHVDLMWALEG